MKIPSLDSKKSNCNTGTCGSINVSGLYVENGLQYRGINRLYCKTWDCKRCGPIKAYTLQKRIAVLAKENDLSRMLTLTLDPKKLSDGEDPVELIKNTWRKFRVYLKRKFKKTVTFISVMEYHKSGIPHMHILVDRYIHQKWISNIWDKLGGGRIVDIRQAADLDTAGWYLGKYLSKDVFLNGRKGTRRVSTSRDIKLSENIKKGEWKKLETSMNDEFKFYKSRVRNTVADEEGKLRSFRVIQAVDYGCFGWPSTRTKVDLEEVEFPPGFSREDWILVGYEDKNENSSIVRSSVEQGTEAGGVFDPSPEGIADKIREFRKDCDFTGIRRSGNGQKGGPEILQSNDSVP